MKPLIAAAAALTLIGCQSMPTKINGVEIDRENIAWGVFGAAVAAWLYYELDDNPKDPPEKLACKTLSPDGSFCAIPLD